MVGADTLEQSSRGEKHQQQKENPEDRKIFVGGIGPDVTNEDLQQYFQQYGEVSQVQVKIDRITGRPRGFAFVDFATPEASKLALAEKRQNIKGKDCEVKAARSRENKKVFVGGLPAEHPEEELRKHFEQYGKVEDIEWPYHKQTKDRRNFAFIVFEEDEAADRAAAIPKQVFSDRECDVKKAVPQNRRNNNFRTPMNIGRTYGGNMRPQMPMQNAAPWFGNGWNQMAAAGVPYGAPAQAGGAGTGGWGDWYTSGGFYPTGTQQTNYSGYGTSGYDYGQNGAQMTRGQQQNGNVPQGQRYQQTQY